MILSGFICGTMGCKVDVAVAFCRHPRDRDINVNIAVVPMCLNHTFRRSNTNKCVCLVWLTPCHLGSGTFCDPNRGDAILGLRSRNYAVSASLPGGHTSLESTMKDGNLSWCLRSVSRQPLGTS